MASDDIYIYGVVKDYRSGERIPDARVEVFADGSRLTTLISDSVGRYGMQFPFDRVYLLRYSAQGKVAKSVEVDARHVPVEQRNGGLGMNVDITLLHEMPGVDLSFMEHPFGKAAWSAKDTVLSWDMGWTEEQRGRLAKVLREYGQ